MARPKFGAARRTVTTTPRKPIVRQNSTLSSNPPQRSLRPRITKPNYIEQPSQCTEDILMEDVSYSFDFESNPKSSKRKHSEISSDIEPQSKEIEHSREADLSKSIPQSSGRAIILELPQEILQEICLLLPFASDAVPLLYTCKTMYNTLGNNNFFWFKRRRQFLEYNPGYSHYYTSDPYTGVVKRDMTEKYDATKDYKALVLKAYAGKTGFLAADASKSGGNSSTSGSESPEPAVKKRAKKGEGKAKKDNILRCQICCIQRAYKQWDAFNKALCPSCYELHAIDRTKVAFLNKLRVTKMTLQYRRRGRSKRYTYWLADVEKEIKIQYPGKTLQQLIDEAEAKKAARQQRCIQSP